MTLTAITDNATSMLVSLALDAAASKHLAIAQNIANANNEGYRPMRVDFDKQIALYKDELLNRDNDAVSARLLETLHSATAVSQAPESTAAKVQLDVEVANMTRNAVHYQALLTAHAKMASLLSLAINGGR